MWAEFSIDVSGLCMQDWEEGLTNNCFLPPAVETILLKKCWKMLYCLNSELTFKFLMRRTSSLEMSGFQRPQCSYVVFHRCLLKVALDLNSSSVVVSNQLSQTEHKLWTVSKGLWSQKRSNLFSLPLRMGPHSGAVAAGLRRDARVILCVHAQLCLTLWNHPDWSLPDPSVHKSLWARILEWAISSSRGCPWTRNQTRVSCVSFIGRQILYQLPHLGSP